MSTHESSSAIAHEVRELEFQLSEAKAGHGKTLLLLNKAAFETIPGLESTVTVLREQNRKLREVIKNVPLWIECWEGRVQDGKLTLTADEGLSIIDDYKHLLTALEEK